MKIYTIKHKGKTWLGNMMCGVATMKIDEFECYAKYCFFTKKAAKKYMSTFSNKEYLEIVSAEVNKSLKDNRNK